jgi:HK97 family phage prohead protease
MATRERRFSPTASLRIERRGEGDAAKQRIVGHAAVFEQWTTLYEGRYWVFKEVIRRGAFANAIKEKQDVRSLFNHDPNFVLGRTTSGTLLLSEDKDGLLSDTEPSDSQTVRDLVLTPIARGDVTGMSFAFMVRRAEKQTTTEDDDKTIIDCGGERLTITRDGERYIEERELLDLDLYDVSPVTYPAYEQTDVALRSMMGIEERAKLMDVPHRVKAPKRDEFAAWLAEQRAASPTAR